MRVAVLLVRYHHHDNALESGSSQPPQRRLACFVIDVNQYVVTCSTGDEAH